MTWAGGSWKGGGERGRGKRKYNEEYEKMDKGIGSGCDKGGEEKRRRKESGNE